MQFQSMFNQANHFKEWDQPSTNGITSNHHSLGSINQPQLQKDIVINEIMYDPPFGQEILNLLNCSTRDQMSFNSKDGSWKMALNMTSPMAHSLHQRNYLVIAKNPEKLKEAHPGLKCLGPFKGKLANDGERIRLVDQNGNLADQIHIVAKEIGQSWPEGKVAVWS
jgi:hypothetical protein